MKNTNYMSEMMSARLWIEKHNHDRELKLFLKKLEETVDNSNYNHADRWCMVYEWMEKHYPKVPGNIIVGIAYLVEE